MHPLALQVLAATQTPGESGKKWFQGTADAVRQFHWLFEVLKPNNSFNKYKLFQNLNFVGYGFYKLWKNSYERRMCARLPFG